ncbi:MAG: FecR family protein [Flavitalea sp.]
MARKLAGAITPTEAAELEQLLKSNPDAHFPLQTLTDLWKNDRYKLEDDDPELNDAYFDHIERLNNTEPEERRSFTRFLPVASIVILLAVMVYFIIPANNKKQPATVAAVSEVATKPGSKTNLVLPDGSRVWLNAKSTLTYDKDFNTRIREVRLSGEAFFDVKKDSSRPFLIHTSDMDLRVLGTTFNVKSYPGDHSSEASLITGSLEISLNKRNKEKITLRPTEKIVVTNDKQTTPKGTATLAPTDVSLVSIRNITHFKSNDSLIVETSWMVNKLVFQDESFAEIALKMERWFGTRISISDKKIAQLHFTGMFEKESVEQALHAMSITEPFIFRKNGDGILITAFSKNKSSKTKTKTTPLLNSKDSNIIRSSENGNDDDASHAALFKNWLEYIVANPPLTKRNQPSTPTITTNKQI